MLLFSLVKIIVLSFDKSYGPSHLPHTRIYQCPLPLSPTLSSPFIFPHALPYA